MSRKGRRDRSTQKIQPVPTPAALSPAPSEAVTVAPASTLAAPTHDEPLPPPVADLPELETGKVGMIAFLSTEVAFFSTLIAVFVAYMTEGHAALKQVVEQQGIPDPEWHKVFKMWQVLLATACLLSSSVTIHYAHQALNRGALGLFRQLWLLTIVLGALFLVGTGVEWHDLIMHWRVTPWRNLFGTTYFTLVGFHAFHVTVGVILLTMVFGLGCSRLRPEAWPLNAELVSWYWHFVDGVWLVVFTLVYLVGR